MRYASPLLAASLLLPWSCASPARAEVYTIFADDFDGTVLDDAWHADCPVRYQLRILRSPDWFFKQILGDYWMDAWPESYADQVELDGSAGVLRLRCGLHDPTGNERPLGLDMWTERAGAPIVWRPAPGGHYYAETRVSLGNLEDAQAAGFVVYEGPDGANGAFTCGLDTWPGGEYLTVALQRLGGGSNQFSPGLTLPEGALYLRMLREEQGATDNYRFWYKETAEAEWTLLGDYAYGGQGARVGLFLKNDETHRHRDVASFDYFRVTWDGTPAVETPAGATTVAWDALSTLADGTWEAVYVTGAGASNGPIELLDVEVADHVVRSVGGGRLRYTGPMSDLLGDGFDIEEGTQDEDGLRLVTTFHIPPLIGGGTAAVTFLLTTEGYVTPRATEIDIPQAIQRGAFKMERIKLVLDPDAGTFGGGALMGLTTMQRMYGGWLTLRSGVSVDFPVDLTLLGAGASGLAIPLGNTGMLLDYIGALIENDLGLSNPNNWDQSNLIGQFDMVSAAGLPIGPNTYPAFKFTGEGVWSIHDGSFDFNGTGLLGGCIEVGHARHRYDPLCNITSSGDFNLGPYRGSAEVRMSSSGVGASFNGSLSIPGDVPWIGGMSLGSAGASLDNTTVRGHASLDVAHGTKEVCHNVCSWAPWPISEICNWVCDQVPAWFDVPFDFTFDLESGLFSFYPDPPWKGGAGNAGFNNWSPLPGEKADTYLAFEVPEDVPGVFFRVHYDDPAVTAVHMQIRTPSGTVLDSTEGQLPLGYDAVAGFSRFNPEAMEQTILVAQPEAGQYRVEVMDAETLGGFIVEAIVQDDRAPEGGITSITPGEAPGTYSIAWTASDDHGLERVRLHLDEDREGRHGFLVEAFDIAPDTKAASYTHPLDTTVLDIPGGHYFVALEIDDGRTTPRVFHSHGTVLVTPAGRPEPPAHLRFAEGDRELRLAWAPSATEGVTGYLVRWREDHEDLGAFEAEQWVPAPASGDVTTTLTGLENGVPRLLWVVAVGADYARSAHSEILRVTPRAPDGHHPPAFVTDLDEDATAGFDYWHLARVVTTGTAGEELGWMLLEAPEGMTIERDTGLIRWLPTEAQVGDHVVTVAAALRVGDYATVTRETWTVHVYPPDHPAGLREHLYAFASHPDHETAEGAAYRYQPVIQALDLAESAVFELLTGPEGMTINPATGLLAWDVPAGATGAWVRLAATLDGRHTIEQDFYLFVRREDMKLVEDTPAGCFGGALEARETSRAGADLLVFVLVALVLAGLPARALQRRVSMKASQRPRSM